MPHADGYASYKGEEKDGYIWNAHIAQPIEVANYSMIAPKN